MYVPRHFAEDDTRALHDLMAHHDFATLVTVRDGTPFASHLPLLIDREAGARGTLIGHMARNNPQWRGFEAATEALAIFQGPHAYVSPSWYVSKDVVPTWNYTVVHAYGTPRLIDDHVAVLAVLERLVAQNEGSMDTPWRMETMDRSYRDLQMRGIVAFELPIARLEGKFKLNQNKPEADRRAAAHALHATDDPLANDIATLMDEHNNT